MWTWILEIRGKIPTFLLVGPKVRWPRNILKIHPIAVSLFLTALVSVCPFRFLQEAGKSKLFITGPFAGDVTSTRWAQYDTQHSQTHSHNLLAHVQSRNGLGMCFQDSESAGRHTALTLEVRSSGQAWRSHVLETRQFLLGRGLKTHSLLMSFLPWRKIAFPEFCVLRVSHCLK